MDQHITYHPVVPALLQGYTEFLLAEDGPALARSKCDAAGIGPERTRRLLSLLPHFGHTAGRTFDQTHGFRMALTQSFFAKYFYLCDASLSRVGHLLGDYTSPLVDLMPGLHFDLPARNRLHGRFSSGVFIRPDAVEHLMRDMTGRAPLRWAIEEEFPGRKLDLLVSSLELARKRGAGLIEAIGVVDFDPAGPSAGRWLGCAENCDPFSLHVQRRAATASL